MHDPTRKTRHVADRSIDIGRRRDSENTRQWSRKGALKADEMILSQIWMSYVKRDQVRCSERPEIYQMKRVS
jgi:hypothetical protein